MSLIFSAQNKFLMSLLVLLALLSLSVGGGWLLDRLDVGDERWYRHHAVTTATILETQVVARAYTNAKGAPDWHNVQELAYSFTVDGQRWDSSVALDELQAGALSGPTIEVWYDPQDPSHNLPALSERLRHRQRALWGNAIAILPFATLIVLAFAALLGHLRIRKADKVVIESGRRETAWILPHQRMIVFFDAKTVIRFRYQRAETERVLKAWRLGTRADRIAVVAEEDTLVRMPLNQIDSVSVRDDKTHITVICNQQPFDLPFHDKASRDAAMRHFQLSLPSNMLRQNQRRSALGSAQRTLMSFGLGLAIALWADQTLIWWLLAAVSVLFLLPRLAQRLAHPTEYRTIVRPEYASRPATSSDIKPVQ